MFEQLKALRYTVIPPWGKWVAGLILLVVGAALTYSWGYTSGVDSGTKTHTAYVNAQTTQTVKVAEQQVKVVTKVETVYRDRVQIIYREGKTIENQIPNYIKPADDNLFAVPVGLVRVLDAAWTGEAAGPADGADREPSEIPISQIALTQVGNITVCHVWREQALGWRQFYGEQQRAINGAPGDWYKISQ